MFKKNTNDKGIELIYEIDENEKLDNVSIGMMKNNDIEALFPVDMITNDTKTQLKYQVGKAKSLNEYIKEELTKEDLLAVFENICKDMSCIEEYMLLEDQVILENDYIFVEGNNIRLIFISHFFHKMFSNLCQLFFGMILKLGRNSSMKLRLFYLITFGNSFEIISHFFLFAFFINSIWKVLHQHEFPSSTFPFLVIVFHTMKITTR